MICLCVAARGECILCGAQVVNIRQVCKRKCGDALPEPTVDAQRENKLLLFSAPSAYGPGTELKKLLAKVGITASPDCSCNAKARLMDERGIKWCETNLDEIVGWLREEAGKRGLPFVDVAGRVLVRRAIANARKAANAERPSLSAGG